MGFSAPEILRYEPADDHALKDEFRLAMRELAGGVAVITVGEGKDRTGLTATSVSSFSAEPPRLLLCINQSSSSWPALKQYGRFGVNLLAQEQDAVADRFAGRGGIKGEARYEGAGWQTLATGAQLLDGALAAIDCEVEEAIIRHSHAIVIGAVKAIRLRSEASPLLYWRGGYQRLSPVS